MRLPFSRLHLERPATPSRPFIAAMVGLAGLIFAADLVLHQGIAAGVPYVAVVLLALRFRTASVIVVAATACTFLAVIGFHLSTTYDDPLIVVTNRGLAIFAIWVTAVVGIWVVREMEIRDRTDAELAAIVESSDDAILGQSLDGIITSWNRGAERIYGYRARDVIGQPVTILHPEGGYEEVAILLRRLRRGERIDPFESIRRTRDGRLINVSVSISPIRDARGRIIGASKTTRDITERKRAESRLRETEDRLRRFAEQVREVFYISDLREPTMIYISPAFEEIWGRACEDAYDDPLSLLDGVHPEDRDRIVEAVEAQLAGRETEEEYRVVRPDGSVRWIRDRAVPIFDEDGRVQHVAGIAEDVTPRKEVEQALRDSNERMNMILESVQDAFYGLDRQWRYTYLNSACQAFAREPIGELPGEIIWDRYPELRETIIEKQFRIVMEERTPVHFETQGVISKKWFEFHVYPSREGISVCIRDLTTRKQAEETLRDSEARKGAILEASLDAVLSIDENGRIVEWNTTAEQVFGYSRDEVIGQEMAKLVIPERLRRDHRKGLAHYLATGEGPVLGRRIEMPALRRDGSEFPAELAIVRVDLPGRALFTGFVRDITERKQSECERARTAEQLQQKTQEIEEFLSIVSHDLRRPVVSIGALMGMIREGLGPDVAEETREDFDLLESEVRRMKAMVEELNNIARRQAGQVMHSPVDLRELIESCVRQFDEQVEEKSIDVQIDCGPEIVVTSERHLKEALINLVENAILHGCPQPGSTIEIRCKTDHNRVTIAVADRGPGIPPDQHQTIFRLYGRLAAAETVPGSGVGLFAAQRLIRMLGGEIQVESQSGNGATFRLIVPRGEESATPALHGGTGDAAIRESKLTLGGTKEGYIDDEGKRASGSYSADRG